MRWRYVPQGKHWFVGYCDMGTLQSTGFVGLSYISNSVLLPGVEQQDQFAQILDVSLRKNADLGVTGALLFHDERWLQVLEGPQKVVEDLFATIRRDPRHENVTHQGTLPIASRQFAEWSMAFIDPGAAGAAFCGVSLKELQETETASAAPVIEWMKQVLTDGLTH